MHQRKPQAVTIVHTLQNHGENFNSDTYTSTADPAKLVLILQSQKQKEHVTSWTPT